MLLKKYRIVSGIRFERTWCGKASFICNRCGCKFYDSENLKQLCIHIYPIKDISLAEICERCDHANQLCNSRGRLMVYIPDQDLD